MVALVADLAMVNLAIANSSVFVGCGFPNYTLLFVYTEGAFFVKLFFKLNDKVLFRQYSEYGYITDNSMFGYRFLSDKRPVLEEKFVSQSGSIMLGMLSRIPQELDVIVKKLLDIFIDVDYEILKQDTFDFFMHLAKEGYLNYGESFEECNENSEKVFNNNYIIPSIDSSNRNFSNLQKNFLRSIHVEIANICNERCIHCFIPEKCKVNTILPELFYKIIREGRAMNIVHVTLTGGEPLLHPNFIDFLKRCHELDLSVNVLSNLTLLTDEIISEMKNNPLLSVQTSLYSMTPFIHDTITHLKGSFEKTRAGILRLITAGIPVQVSCQVMKQNKDSFTDVIQWGNDHNIPVAFNYIIFGEYDRTNLNLQHRLSVNEIEETFSKQISQDYAQSLFTEAQKTVSLEAETPICSVCRYYFGVTAEGDAFPCAGWQAKKLGNLKEHSVKEIWEDSQEIEYLRQIQLRHFTKCVTCKDRGYCTICMMTNSNESPDGDMFHISNFQCEVAAMIHSKVEDYLRL